MIKIDMLRNIIADFLRGISYKNGEIELNMISFTTHIPLLFEIVNGVTVHMPVSGSPR